MDNAGDVISQVNKEKSAIIEIQNAIRNKNAIDEFSTIYAKNEERMAEGMMDYYNGLVSQMEKDKAQLERNTMKLRPRKTKVEKEIQKSVKSVKKKIKK